jgi:hypothetical protein
VRLRFIPDSEISVRLKYSFSSSRQQAGQRLRIEVVGLARIAQDVTPALAKAAIESVSVLGAFQASPAVRQALSDRIK